jgi:hypothetical protein
LAKADVCRAVQQQQQQKQQQKQQKLVAYLLSLYTCPANFAGRLKLEELGLWVDAIQPPAVSAGRQRRTAGRPVSSSSSSIPQQTHSSTQQQQQ